jgi:hypothetical protein
MSWMTVPTTTSFVNPLPVYAHGEGWQGRPLVSTSIGGDSLNSLGSHGGEVADPMIEARFWTFLNAGLKRCNLSFSVTNQSYIECGLPLLLGNLFPMFFYPCL